MTRHRRTEQRNDPPFADGENPYVPPIYYLVVIAVLALVVLATFL